MFEKFFKLKEHGTNVKTEIIAGLTTFLSMAYILGVNPNILGSTGMNPNAVFLATALSAGFACILMGVLANYPVALAAGMGVNALFAFTICGEMKFSPAAGLAAVFVSGLIFLLISVTGIRKAIINAIPQQLKLAIGSGIGFYIAFIGLKNAGIVVANEATFVGLGNLQDPKVLLAVFGIIVTLALLARGTSAAVFYGLVATAVVGLICGFMGIVDMPKLPNSLVSFNLDTSGFGLFMNGFKELFASPKAFIAIFSLLFIDFFDTAGTLISVANQTNLVNEDGELDNIEQAMASDAVGTVFGAMVGCSTVTSYIESTTGVNAGGRTGLTAITTGILFFLAILFSPILSVVTNAVTAPALITVGILMAKQLSGIDWDDFVFAASAFFTIIGMLLCYSISEGIALGFIVYANTMLFSGRIKEVKPIIWALVAIFVAYFIFL